MMVADTLRLTAFIRCSKSKEDTLDDQDWRNIYFSCKNIIRLTKNNYILKCSIANDANGDCKYAVCEDYHQEKGTKEDALSLLCAKDVLFVTMNCMA